MSQAFARMADVGSADNALLNRIVDGLLIDAYRRRNLSREFPVGLLHELDGLANGSYEIPEEPSFPDEFDEAVRGLGDPERDAFILTELRGLTVRETADVLDSSKSTVARRAEAATHSIREEIR